MGAELERAYLPDPARPGLLPAQVHDSDRPLAALIVGPSEAAIAPVVEAVGRWLPQAVIRTRTTQADGPATRTAALNELAEQVPGHDLLMLDNGARLGSALTDSLATMRRAGSAGARLAKTAEVSTGKRAWAKQEPIAALINRDAWDALGGLDAEFVTLIGVHDFFDRAATAGWTLETGLDLVGHATPRVVLDRGDDPDLAEADRALLLELRHGARVADAALAAQRGSVRARTPRKAPPRATSTPVDPSKPGVIITTNRLVYGGAERHHAVLAAELVKRGYEVVIVVMQRLGPVLAEIPLDVRVVRRPFFAPAIRTHAAREVLITADTNTETGFGRLWRSLPGKRRWLVASHSHPSETSAHYPARMAQVMSTADLFVALAAEQWEVGSRYQKIGRDHVIAPNGLLHADELPAWRERLADKPIRPASEPLHLVILGRISENPKNPGLLVEALAGLHDLPWRLTIFGDGPDKARLQAATPAAIADRVTWAGWVPGPQVAMADADLVCIPSKSEAFPLVILEAMARGIPVAASAVGAIPTMLDGGRAGFLVPQGDLQAWRDTLRGILTMDRGALARLGAASLDRLDGYTIEAMTDGYEAAFARAWS